MRARDVMSKEVISIGPDALVRDAVALMLKHRISGLPVVDGYGRLVGLITENDLVLGSKAGLPVHLQLLDDLLAARKPHRHQEQVKAIAQRPVRDFMVEEVVVAGPDTPVAELVTIMMCNDFKRIPIVAQDKLVGIVTRADILKIMVQ